MCERNPLLSTVKRQKLLVIVRLRQAHPLETILDGLARGGLELAEVTIDTPGALEAIRTLKQRGTPLSLGVGTVTTRQHVHDAASAGARFIVTPGLVPAVIEEAKAAGLAVICGALTPSEMLAAVQQGADIIKLFPASSLGPAYLEQVRAPLKDIPILAVGGIDAANAGEYLRAGAIGVAVGSALVSERTVDSASLASLEARTKALLDKLNAQIDKAKGSS